MKVDILMIVVWLIALIMLEGWIAKTICLIAIGMHCVIIFESKGKL